MENITSFLRGFVCYRSFHISLMEVTILIDKNYIVSLKNQIWTTRVSRVNAEKRLKSKESFIQTINIYYSCFTVILSICLLVKQDFAYNLLTLIMTIVLMVSILYLKSLRYIDRAVAFRKNYTELQKLEFKLSHASFDVQEINNIETEYCDLLADAENHITFDYLKTLVGSNKDYKKERYTRRTFIQYIWNIIWRLVLKGFCVFLPLILSLLTYWGKINGWFISV